MAENSGPELFFALVGATGTDLGATSNLLKKHLVERDYRVCEIRLSSLLDKLPVEFENPENFEDLKIDNAMSKGTWLREKLGGDAVARLGIWEIRKQRKGITGEIAKPASRTAYILRSLKHPDEAEALRNLYKDAFHVISVYEPQHLRLLRLGSAIQKSRRGSLARAVDEQFEADCKNRAQKLIAKDADEHDRDLGQHLKDTFYLADLFVADGELFGSALTIDQQIARYVDLLFGAPFVTPTDDEYAAFQAQAAAYRSADLSRQVGAVICEPSGSLIASGYNEVPIAGGGHFTPGDAPKLDNRDYKQEMDPSAAAKHEIICEMFEALSKAGWLDTERASGSAASLTDRSLNKPIVELDGPRPILKNARITNIIEFGRIVHAEMSALTDAARNGRGVRDATLYCTTFPCHICARHIIASGIKRVVYIEPYPKSQAKELYGRAIRVDCDQDHDENAVEFEPFVGVAPRQFLRMFKMPERKNKRTGYAVSEAHRDAVPRFSTLFTMYGESEAWYVEALDGVIRTEV